MGECPEGFHVDLNINVQALDDLKKNEDIMILPTDKGRCMVVMDETEYHAKVDSLLADRKFYKVLDKDPTSSTERKMNAALLGLKKNNTIPEPLYCRLRSSDGHISLLYGLPKIHKPGIKCQMLHVFLKTKLFS